MNNGDADQLQLLCGHCDGPAFACKCFPNLSARRGAPVRVEFNPHLGVRYMFKNVKFALVPFAALAAMAQEAHASLPASVTSAITEGGVDGGTLMGALAAAGAALYIIWKILKKAGVML